MRRGLRVELRGEHHLYRHPLLLDLEWTSPFRVARDYPRGNSGGQFPTDATRFWWHLCGSYLQQFIDFPISCFRGGCGDSTTCTATRFSTWSGLHLSGWRGTTLEATQGEILSQFPTDATRFWWHLCGSYLKKIIDLPISCFRGGCGDSTTCTATCLSICSPSKTATP